MERMLRFSFDHARVIRLMYFDENNKLRQVNATVIAYDEETVDFITTRSPRTVTVPIASILSVDFEALNDMYDVVFSNWEATIWKVPEG